VPEWSGASQVVASVGSFGSFNLGQGAMARAVRPAPVLAAPAAPASGDRPPSEGAQHVVSAVAFAPATMSALIEAQASLTQPAPLLARDATVQVIDELIYRLDAGATSEDMPFEVRRLHAARMALAQSPMGAKA
jgi:hypothetical protein